MIFLIFIMFLQYCNSIKVIYVNNQNKTIINIKKMSMTLNAFFFLFNGWKEYSF